MPRYLLTLEYDGKPFIGWQRQRADVGDSVQGALEEAILRFCGQKATLHGAGRTDRGVHALAQRAHVDLDLSRYSASERGRRSDEALLREALNFHLREYPLAVREVVVVDSEFHARFSVKSRSYLYRVVVSQHRPILREARVWHRPLTRHTQARIGARGVIEKLDFLREQSARMLGTRDFSAFRAADCQSPSAVKHMQRIDIELHSNDELRLTFRASGFLYRQVRLMVATLIALGEGRLSDKVFEEFLSISHETSDDDLRRLKRLVPAPAPACGLYFADVEY